MRKILIILPLLLLSASALQAQILISLLLGDKLNSEKLEFGLDGGLAVVNTSDREASHARLALNLGFYFDFQLSEHWYLHTGCIVKSPAGTRFLDPYPLGIADLDAMLSSASVTRKLRYFHVPALMRYRFRNFVFMEAGPQIGLMNKAVDQFYVDIQRENDLVYTNKIRDQYNAIDFGFTGGLGYKLLQGEGIALGLRYYLGLSDLLKENSGNAVQNRILYLYTSIPIGAANTNDP